MDKECATVPYYVVESLIAVHKRQTIQLAIINLITVAVLIFGLAYIWTSYDYQGSETNTTTTVAQDGDGVNIYGDSNEVSNENGANNPNPDNNQSTDPAIEKSLPVERDEG